ncbi:uncharacterized protein LOC105181007 [Harpegnathos saltator]|uniref:Uncharacterized protein n=1 Tax=Harpegnathos saltator TaxID=610380 RepID=E2BBL4_HARSA|nr:uncharacterized protein LOC105181007 [Harpegnathos saltator]EFN86891.1 hypothetical protein EAI_11951 [Harpegnathos saltator]
MAAHHCSIIAVFFLGILSLARTISLPYEDIHLAFPAATRLIYTASESDPDFSGYSYATQDLNGGGSNVVFATGANSMSKLKEAMGLIYEADDTMKMPKKYTQGDMSDGTRDNIQESPASVEQQSKPEIEPSITKQEDFVLNDASDQEKKLSKNPEMDSSLEHRISPQELPFVHVPYPAFRANFLNLQFPTVFPRYHHVSSNVIQSQYYPNNPYAHLQFPLHDFPLYNPSAPLFYQAPITVNQVPVNDFSHVSLAAVKDITMSVKANFTDSTKTSVIQSASSVESDMIEPRTNLEPMANKVKEASPSEPASSTVEPMTTPKAVNEEATSAKVNFTDSIKTNAIQSASSVESDMIESRTNLEPMANKVKEAPLNEPALSTVEPTTTHKAVSEEIMTESIKSTVKSRRCGDHVMKNAVSSTEFANAEMNTSTKEPSAETLSTTKA